MKFNYKKFKKNILFFVISFFVISCVVLLSLIKENEIENEELSDEKINVDGLVINEIMSSNKGTIVDENGVLCDYVEIYNGTDEDINLKGYGLSDKSNEVKFTFDNTIIKSKGYVVVFLGGSTSHLHASFKLSKNGDETVTLFNKSGKIINKVKTVKLESNTVMARNSDGEWVIQSSPTPGFDNNKEGHEKFIESLKVTDENQTIVINEVLASNKGNFKNKDGIYSGYIEIKNVSDKTINLENYSLSNSIDVLYKWQFPSVKLSSGEVLVVFTSGSGSLEGELNTSFTLDSKNGYAVITGNDGLIIDYVKYENLANGKALIRSNNGMVTSSLISPGYENNSDGINEFEKEYLSTPSTLIINEVMNNNYSYLPQNGGNYYDYIELYNNSSKSINLKDYCLTTNINTICMYNLPDVKVGKGEYFIIMASGNTELSNDDYYHANFKLSDSEALYITKANSIIDSLYMSDIPNGYSYGRSGSYGLFYFSKPSPNSENKSGIIGVSYESSASEQSGIFNDVDTVKVSLSGGGVIYYTLDGSEPSVYSNVYSSPLEIKKTTVLKTMSSMSGLLNSDVSTYSYIINENHKLDVLSLSINPNDLKTLNTYAWNEDLIKKCYVELLSSEGVEFQISAGLKLFGGSTRGHAKKSYEVKFTKEFGKGTLEYKVFDDVNSSVFNSLVLRTGSQDEMGDASKKTLIRDIVATSLVSEYTSVDVQSYRPVILYINGSYHGIYFIREKVDESFISNHYNVNATNENTNIIRIDGQVKSGSINSYNELISFVSKNDMSKSENYNYVKELIDIENLCDFWIAEAWTANNDIVNCRFFSNSDVDSGKWKFIFYDVDFGMYNVNTNYYTFSTSTSGMTVNGYSTVLLRNLMKNSEFRKTYLERLKYNLDNTWSESNVINKINSVIEEISTDEIKRNLSRWSMSYSTWEYSVDYIKNYASNRRKYMVQYAKSYFGLSSDEMKEYFGE